MKYNLFVIYWHNDIEARNQEIIETFNKNIQLDVFENFTIFAEPNCIKKLKEQKINFEKIKLVEKQNRQTYQDIFEYSNALYGKDEYINILANSDIYFDKTILMAENMDKNDFYCITRYNLPDMKLESGSMNDVCDSQDVWIWKGNCYLLNCNFYLGIPGCDNKIAFMGFDQGYRVCNPCLDIKTYHNHKTQIRNGTSKNVENYRLQRPYCYIKAQKLGEKYVLVLSDFEYKPLNIKVSEDEFNLLKTRMIK